MSKSTVATGNALTQKLYEEKLFRDSFKESFVSRFMNEKDGAKSIIQVKTSLQNQKGDRETFGLAHRLTGAGVTAGQTLEGNEEAVTTSSFNVTLGQLRHAVRDNGAMDRQRPVYDLTSTSRMLIEGWMTEQIDTQAFAAWQLNPTRTFYASTSATSAATAKAALAATDKLTPSIVSRIKAFAKTGGNRSQTPVKPVKINGSEYYIMVIHPDQEADLFEDPVMQQARREAEVRGSENPLFTGARAIWNGVIFHSSEYIDIATDGGGGAIPWAKSLFLGQSSLCWAWGQRPKLVRETFDYGNEIGDAVNMIFGVQKPNFAYNGTNKDYGMFNVYTSRTQISDV